MLAGFVVPHAHYRVFHGDPAADSQHAAPNDQFPLALSPRRVEGAPTDLHLREFAQLEVQVKALQLQGTPYAVSGALAECFLFYSRLFTVESFPWPDFLAAVCTKLAEHFATSENDIVRSAILRVFQRAKAHVAQVNDPTKLLAHLLGPMTHATSASARTLTLQLLATMPSLILRDPIVQQHILKSISTEDRDERWAAIEAACAFMPLSIPFQKDVLTLSLESKSAALSGLLSTAVSTSIEAQQAWTHCAELYERFADEKSAVGTIRAMTTLTAAHRGVLLPIHSQLLLHVLDHDPRVVVKNFALLVTQQLVLDVSGEEDDQFASLLEDVFSRSLDTPRRTQMRLKLSALLLLDKWSSLGQDLGENAGKLLEMAKTLLSTATDERFGKAYTSIIAQVAHQKLAFDGIKSSEHSVDELLRLLHPRAPVAAKSTWKYALDAVAQLSQEFPVLLAAYVASRLAELLAIPPDIDADISNRRRTAVFRVLGAQLRPPSVDMIHKHLPMLLKELSTVGRTDAQRLRAVAATFFLWTQDIVLASDADAQGLKDTTADFERHLLSSDHYETHSERYEMAKLAILRGRFSLATQLMEVIAAKADSECFGGWLHALQKLCEAESRISKDRSVHLESLQSLARTSTYLQAARTSSFRFDLQLHFVELRLEWMQLLQSAQQVAGEAAFTNSPGNPVGREGKLGKKLRTLAHKFGVLRALLLGADQRDLDILEAQANSCTLLASAVEGFLLLRSPNSIDFPKLKESAPHQSQWNLQMLKMLNDDVIGKLDRVAKLSPTRQPGVGARVLQQLLIALCSIPLAVPKLFFCSRLRSEQRLLSSAQFLTYAENSAFTAKPRSRSQLGVSLGTDFTSVLKGALALSRRVQSYWRKQAESIEAEVLVCLAPTGSSVNASSSIYELADALPEEKLVQHRTIVNLPVAWERVVEAEAIEDDGQPMIYLPFETPVHVKATNLNLKGSFVLVARLALVDRQGERWPLAATGCRRGFIVY